MIGVVTGNPPATRVEYLKAVLYQETASMDLGSISRRGRSGSCTTLIRSMGHRDRPAPGKPCTAMAT